MPAFKGFPPEALEFLRELEANNDRDWFKANRARYDEHLVAPARALGEDLADLGRPHLFRPWNDTRFHARPPIKEQLGLAVGYEGAGGYYVELSLDGLLVAAGLYRPAPDQLDRIRRAIDDGRTAAPLTRAIGRAQKAGLALGEPDARARPARLPGRSPAAATCCAARASRSVAATSSALGCTGPRRAHDPRGARGGDAARALAGRARRPLPARLRALGLTATRRPRRAPRAARRRSSRRA